MKNQGKKFLSDLKLYSDYLRWDNEKNRYETWEEAIESILRQHHDKYGDKINSLLDEIRPTMYNKEVLASQRNLQFRGNEIFNKNGRLYNCSSSYVDRPEVFKQALYLLLLGCGFGFSVEKRFVDKLPTIKFRKDDTITHVIEDSVEGWAIALDILLNSYFNGSEQVRFDYSNIRKKGTLILNRFLAPGPEPLKKSLELIENMLEEISKTTKKLSPLNCYDIICHSSDAVLSAGVRRSALICLFDKDDDEMINAKTGNWYITNPQRARSNNSAKLIKGQYTKEEYDYFAEKIKQYGEPGFVLVNDERFCTNP